MKFGVEGRFHIVKRNSKGEITQEIEQFKNLILDVGLVAALGADNNNNRLYQCYLSTNSASPSAADVAIGGTFVSNSSKTYLTPTAQNLGISEDYAFQQTAKYTFNVGSATGTWSSLAIGVDDTTGGVTTYYLWSRALIKDQQDDPISLTVLADESVDVFYTLTVRRSLTDVITSFSLIGDPTPRTVTFRPHSVTENPARAMSTSVFALGPVGTSRSDVYGLAYSSAGTPALGLITSSGLTGVSLFNWGSGSLNTETTSYDAGTLTKTHHISFTPSIANSTYGICGGYISLDVLGIGLLYKTFAYQFLFDTPIMKTNQHKLTLDFSFTLSRL